MSVKVHQVEEAPQAQNRMSETPSKQVVAKALQEFNVTDSAGRVITLRKPGILAQYRLVQVAGPEDAENRVYMRMILPIIYVKAIDGDPVIQPMNKLQLEALLQRIDEHGIKAIVDGVAEHFGEPDPEADRDALKK